MAWLIFFFEEPISIHLGSWISVGDIQVNYGFLLDSLSMVVMVPVGIVTLSVLFYAIDYMRYDPNRNRFYIILSVFAIFMTVLVISENYIMMFIGWEFVGVVSYLLISFWNTRIAAMKSALSAILLNRMGDTLFVICIATMLSLFHAVDFETIELMTPHIDTYILNLLAIMLLIAATAKSAQLGLHGWLLSAMEGWAKGPSLNFTIWENTLTLFSPLSFFNLQICKYKSSEKSKLFLNVCQRQVFSLNGNNTSFYSTLNKNYNLKYGQHSGNLHPYLTKFVRVGQGSSETLRETIYDLYLIYLLTFNFSYKNINHNYDNNFIYWLIGFTEGDDSFIINRPEQRKNKYLEFKITQSSNDAQILFFIKKKLGFGSVSKQDKNNNTHHFRVRDKNGILKIINLFNGKLYLNKTQNKFKEFVNIYNITYNTNIQILDNSNNKPSLENAWLAGFTDAEGCFTLSYLKNKYVSIRYILSQKNENIFMENISSLLDGNTYVLKKCNTTNMTVNYLKLIKIIKYLNKYGLKTKKLIIYKNWLDVYYRVKKKEHKNPKNLSIIINKINKKYKL